MFFKNFLVAAALFCAANALPVPQAAVNYINKGNNNNNNNNVVVVTQTVYATVPASTATSVAPTTTTTQQAVYKENTEVNAAPAATSTVAATQPTSTMSSDEMLQLVNSERAKYGKAPVQYHPDLIAAAQSQSNYEASVQRMTHDNSAGSLGQRLTNLGFNWSSCAENVATGKEGDVSGVHDLWVGSPPHHDNMLGDYEYYGWSNTGTYWAECFANSM